jgi:hypothetical protein
MQYWSSFCVPEFVFQALEFLAVFSDLDGIYLSCVKRVLEMDILANGISSQRPLSPITLVSRSTASVVSYSATLAIVRSRVSDP